MNDPRVVDDSLCPKAENKNGYHWFATAKDDACGNCGRKLEAIFWGYQSVTDLNSLQLNNSIKLCETNAKTYPVEERLQWHRWCSVFRQVAPFIQAREHAEREAKPNKGLYFAGSAIKEGQAVWADAAGNMYAKAPKSDLIVVDVETHPPRRQYTHNETSKRVSLKIGDAVTLDDVGRVIPFTDRHNQTFRGTAVELQPAMRTVTVERVKGEWIKVAVAPHVVLEHTPAVRAIPKQPKPMTQKLTVGDRVMRVDDEHFDFGVLIPFHPIRHVRPFGKITMVEPETGMATVEVWDRSVGYKWARAHVGPGVELVSEMDVAKEAALKIPNTGMTPEEAKKVLGVKDGQFVFGNVDYGTLETTALWQSTFVHDEVINLTPEAIKRSAERIKNFMQAYGVPNIPMHELTVHGDAAAERWRVRNSVGPCKFKGCVAATYRSHLCDKHLEELKALESGAGIAPKYRYVTQGARHKNVIVTVDVGADWDD